MGKRTDTKRPPGPRGGVPFFGLGFEAMRDLLGFFGDAAREHGDVVRFDFAPYTYVMLNSPETIKHVLVDNAKNYVKGVNYKALQLVLGQGLVTSEGDFWRRQRKLAQPAFHRERLATFVERMTEATAEMLVRWGAYADRATVDVHDEMMRVTLDIVGRTLLSQSLDDRAAGIGDAMAVAVRFAADYASNPFRMPLWVPAPQNLRFRRAMRALDGLVRGVIAERRRSPGEDKRDLLDMLMAARDEETNEAMTDQQLKDEVMTIVTAGHETTANAMSWTLYLLSKHPDVARRVSAEIDAVLGTRRPARGDLSKMPYAMAVLQESMRILPPVWSFERAALEDDVIGGYTIEKGTQIGVFPYVLHRHPRYWENPEGFDPERFLSGAERPRYTYLPFGGGPRVCIGNAFAMMEAQILLAMIVQRYRLELLPGARVAAEPVVTLRPRHGMPMMITPRAPSARDGAPQELLLDRGEGRRRADGVERGGAKPPVTLG
ncbi:cytochrome P450 [Pendulispora albinea]|uniref:Cytochrome P450 n=1 Tax=Pendulispora albinea TaxID=2741071 RepID=A0ABZ2M053_9BACT